MIYVAARRIVSAAIVILVLAAIIFILQDISPVDPVRQALGGRATDALVTAERHRLGYDRPLVVRYANYIWNIVQGNLGTSLRTKRPVSADLGTFVPASLELAIFAFLFVLPLCALFSLINGRARLGGWLFRSMLLLLSSAPVFLVALLSIVFFFKNLHWLPATGQSSISDMPSGPTHLLVVDAVLHLNSAAAVDALQHLILPACCLAIGPAVAIGRVLRSGLVSAGRSDYARASRVRGMGEFNIVLRHGIRNSASSTLAMTGLQASLLFGNLVLVETVFSWPGIGLYASQSIEWGDFPAIAGFTLLLGLAFVLINLAVDLLSAWADPRLRG